MNDVTILSLSHSPDPDDAFAWWGVLSGATPSPGLRFECTPRTMQQANEACLAGEVDVAAVSSAAWPFFADRYAVLDVGASVGRGYGPALASRATFSDGSLDGATVALPGSMTTGALLFRLFHPGAKVISMHCSSVAPAIVAGEVDAGVLIHEELMNYSHRGLRRIECLGKRWEQESGLPIPVGLVVVKRSLGEEVMQGVATALRDSIVAALGQRRQALDSAMEYTVQAADGIAERFVDMFTNEDSLHLDDGCLEALRLLYAHGYSKGLLPAMPALSTVRPAAARANAREEAIHAVAN